MLVNYKNKLSFTSPVERAALVSPSVSNYPQRYICWALENQ
jgi:hypothetical protein